jgi:protein phosphatase
MTETKTGTGTADATRALAVTDLSLVVLIGASGSGKSTFAARHFKPTEIISSDFCRGLVSDDENDQSATSDAFDVLHYIAGKRLAAGRRTVVDATSVQREARAQLVKLAREHDVLPIAIVLDVPEQVCLERNAARPDRAALPRHVVQRHQRELRRSLRGLEREGFRKVHVLRGVAQIDAARIVTERRYNDLAHLTGPFDIIGDVHGCAFELEALLDRLGYEEQPAQAPQPVPPAPASAAPAASAAQADAASAVAATADVASVGANPARRRAPGTPLGPRVHPQGRTAVFVGDLVDRGPDSPGVLRRVMAMVEAGSALCVPGNHENKLGRWLKGRQVRHTHGLAETVEQLEREHEADPAFRDRVRTFVDGLVSHYVLDGGRLVVCHAGLPEKYHGRTSGRVRSHALYGETTGETDEFGLPVRYPWAEDYRGRAAVVYGHTPVPTASWLNNTICLDTGAVFGGKLTALRWPEREIVDVPAERVWYEPVRPLESRTQAPGGREGRPLDLADVTGRRIVETSRMGRLAVREENAAAALEVMSRFAIDPRLLTYLPPTMAPCATSQAEGYLEHPREAFAAFRESGVRHVVCEEKHMGSRAVALVCRDEAVAKERFGVEGVTGALHTRTGRPFFDDPAVTEEFLARLRAAVGAAGLWDELDTGWLLLDAELLPWSLKASGLLRKQYAAVGAAAGAVFPSALAALEAAAARGADVTGLLARQRERAADAGAFTDAYRRYCWTTDGLDGVRLAPFQLLAAEGASLAGLPHDRQLELIDRLVDADAAGGSGSTGGSGSPDGYGNPDGSGRTGHADVTVDAGGAGRARPGGLLQRTGRLMVDTADEQSVEAGVRWWLDATEAGGEGMVVKPLDAQVRDEGGRLVQPGIKCRGREYLRIIYGPEYTRPEHLARLRTRALGHKRSLALREYALGLEALDRVAAGEPLWRVHEAVFGVLALESEPVDPRL